MGVQVPDDLITDCVRLCCSPVPAGKRPFGHRAGCAEQGPGQVRATPATRSTWTRPTGVAKSAGTSGGTSKLHRITGDRTWRWCGRVTGGRCPRSCHAGAASCIGSWWRRCRVGGRGRGSNTRIAERMHDPRVKVGQGLAYAFTSQTFGDRLGHGRMTPGLGCNVINQYPDPWSCCRSMVLLKD